MSDLPAPPVPDTETTPQGQRLLVLAVGSLGVVYGDIGTSPLYALRECFHGTHAVAPEPLNVLGVLSLIFWSLVLVVSLKYLVFILRADNHGEGGILALTALVTPGRADAPLRGTEPTRGWLPLMLGLAGAALLYADGMITPAISVLSAVEGLSVAAPSVLDPYVVPITIAILVGLFLFQVRGTAGVGSVFGPVVFLWFVTMAVLGIVHIVREPHVLLAVNPWYALEFFAANGFAGFVILGTVFLVVTGSEALYADIGHFGTRPIRLTWFAVVLPALLLNYLGQGAFLLHTPHGAVNPFYRMAPAWALWPLVVLATAAAVIASQALITGAFSLTLQAIQLGYSPRATIRHTTAEQRGQIYMPSINWALMAACIVLVLGFGSSSRLAAAYGMAITTTMVITTLLFFVLVYQRWKWGLPHALTLCGGFLLIDLAFFGANTLKIFDGGWFPLLVAGAVFLLLTTWRRGRQILAGRLRERLIPVDLYLAELLSNPPPRVPGTAIFMTGNPVGTPSALRHNVRHNHILHETVVILYVETAEAPHVAAADRIEVEEIGEGFWRVEVKYGFMEEPNVPRALQTIPEPRLRERLAQGGISYFLGRETLIPSDRPGMALWRERLFTWMSRNAQSATTYFNLPAENVVEIGVQIEL
jgi:KUP system potassium uptake protein